jgi:hypothetical protein
VLSLVVVILQSVRAALPANCDADLHDMKTCYVGLYISACRNVDVNAINKKVMLTYTDPNLDDGATDVKEYLSAAGSVVDAEPAESCIRWRF